MIQAELIAAQELAAKHGLREFFMQDA